jgi:hypothetical protein
MAILKSRSKPEEKPAKPSAGRRSFMLKMGTAVSAAMATAIPGMSARRADQKSGSDAEMDRLSRRLGILEDEKSIRKLHQGYEALLDSASYEEAADLFADDGAIAYNCGIFEGRQRGILRLYRECFGPGRTGKKIGPPPGSEAAQAQQQEIIEIAADRMSAKAQFPYAMQVGTPMDSNSQLVNMARLHGEGILKWCECGTCHVAYSREGAEGIWKIQRLEYRAFSKTDYRPGKSNARPIAIPVFAKTYPADPAGPDRLIKTDYPDRKA